MRARTEEMAALNVPKPSVAVDDVRRSVATERTGERPKRGFESLRISAASSAVMKLCSSRTRGDASTCRRGSRRRGSRRLRVGLSGWVVVVRLSGKGVGFGRRAWASGLGVGFGRRVWAQGKGVGLRSGLAAVRWQPCAARRMATCCTVTACGVCGSIVTFLVRHGTRGVLACTSIGQMIASSSLPASRMPRGTRRRSHADRRGAEHCVGSISL
mmetsp:Transcript_57220/g.170197  ORF Transcript_57220/g.170197 Transcript_57220/m.170197 type:complete len:214 (-) Transcript_57220:663-1304(-)